ncbi:S1 family peptidase [Halobacteriovorax sp. YZS-1-1]|uniref:S1 family peptidase n=1 Tax=unclassified Halobacteriovorax TaxID=2639665 RepID=UPI00399B7A6F
MALIRLSLLLTLLTFALSTNAKRYIGGDQWNRPRINKSFFIKQDKFIKELILRTVKVVNTKKRKVGTAFFYKENADHYIFLTNYHVISGNRECRDSKLLLINSEFNKRYASCDGVIQEGTIKSGSDYIYFKVNKEERLNFLSQISEVRTDFSDPVIGDRLVSVGFGAGKANLRRYDAKISMDRDCLYLNGNIDITFNKDKVRDVFFTACDAQSGDSGSAVMNLETGDIIGLFFAVADQKRSNPLTSKEIQDNLGTDYMEFYTNASMSIDLRKIKLK